MHVWALMENPIWCLTEAELQRPAYPFPGYALNIIRGFVLEAHMYCLVLLTETC